MGGAHDPPDITSVVSGRMQGVASPPNLVLGFMVYGGVGRIVLWCRVMVYGWWCAVYGVWFMFGG
jgi:hypothetical protein